MELVPENLVYIGDRAAAEMDLSAIIYDSASARQFHLSAVNNLPQYQNGTNISWINISGLKDIDSIKRLGELYNIHPLTIEDILNTEQQPKMEIFGGYKFFSLKTIQRRKNFRHPGKKSFFKSKKEKAAEDAAFLDEFLIEQISIIILKNVIITFQETPGNSFNGLIRKILEDAGGIRKTGTNYLAYAIIDAVVDEYFLTLDHIEDDIENFEDSAAKTSDYRFIEDIQDTKKYLLQIKRAITPLKDNMAITNRREEFFASDELKPFLQDLQEHLNHAIITVENHREWLSNIMDVNLSVLSYQMNKVMKVLAIISTIFIPLSFIAGVYGMNFAFMPELGHRLGYPVVLGCMGFIAAAMLVFFKINRWF